VHRGLSNSRPPPPCCSAACRSKRRQAVAVRYPAILVLHLQMAAMQMTQQTCNLSSARSPPAPVAAPPAALRQRAAQRPAQHSLRTSAPRASRAARRQAALLVRAVAAAPQAPASKGSTGPPPSMWQHVTILPWQLQLGSRLPYLDCLRLCILIKLFDVIKQTSQRRSRSRR
jgi:hypothetical protein